VNSFVPIAGFPDQKITITGSSGLSKDEVDRMTKEAELHAEDDKKKREAVETHNQLDSTIYQMEKLIKESDGKIPDDKKSKIEAAIADARKDLESGENARMKAALENLQKVGAELYAEAQQAAAAAGEAGAGPEADSAPKEKRAEKDADVVDADFEVVDEDKK
jgi:molecular chaperone DnaK